jgi:cytochrome c-type biogenesis protein CcmH/NrfG
VLTSRDPAIKPLMVDALIASGTKAMGGYHWGLVTKRAREALAVDPTATNSRGAHALLADALFVQGDVDGAIAEYQRAIAEAPRDARLRRHLLRARRQLQQPGDREAPAQTADSAPGEPTTE